MSRLFWLSDVQWAAIEPLMPSGVHQGLLRHSAAVKRTAKGGQPNEWNGREG